MEGLQSAVVHSSKAAPAATAAALAFLASKLISCSALPEAVRLYQQATCIDPKSSRCALGLAQALEVQCDSAGVLQALLGFCQSNHLGQVPLQVRRQSFGTGLTTCMYYHLCSQSMASISTNPPKH